MQDPFFFGRRVFVSNESPNELPLDQFLIRTNFVGPEILPTCVHRPFYRDHSPPPTPYKPPKINRGYYGDESATVPFRANPPMIRGGYYRDESSTNPPRQDPYGGNPVNLHLMRPQDSGYPGYGNYNGQNGGGPYNPQVKVGNGVGGNGKVTLGPEINGANLNIGGGKAGAGPDLRLWGP